MVTRVQYVGLKHAQLNLLPTAVVISEGWVPTEVRNPYIDSWHKADSPAKPKDKMLAWQHHVYMLIVVKYQGQWPEF